MTSEQTQKYNQGRSYSYKLAKNLYKDVLHDAYVKWYDKTGHNLFDEPISRVIKVIKYTWFGYYVNKRKVQNRDVFVEYDDHMVNRTTPEDEMIGKELEQQFTSCDSKMQLEIYLYAVQGYRPYEIAKVLGVSKGLLTYYFKKMAYTAALFN